jgi:hypothetical protein
MAGRTDGFGAQFQAMLAVLIAARIHGYAFVFSDIIDMDHGSPAHEIQDLLYGFKEAFPSTGGKPWALHMLGPEDALVPRGLASTADDVHYGPNPDAYYTPTFRREARALYMSGAARLRLRARPDVIAVHVRRGDVDQRPATIHRFVETDVYVRIIKSLLSRFERDVHVLSEGRAEDFAQLSAIDPRRVLLRLNENFASAHYGMVTAWLLVTARSSFSYSAALLRTGPVFYLPFWHPPLKSWRDVGEALEVPVPWLH